VDVSKCRRYFAYNYGVEGEAEGEVTVIIVQNANDTEKLWMFQNADDTSHTIVY